MLITRTKYIDAFEVSNYTCSFKETETDGGTGTIYANWFDKKTGEYHLIHVGSGDPQTEPNEIFATEKEAQAAASSRLKKVTKNNTVFRFMIAGRPDLFMDFKTKKKIIVVASKTVKFKPSEALKKSVKASLI